MKAGLYTYAWDLADEGYDQAAGRIAGAGFSAVNLATAYHAGRFLLPHNPRRKVYDAEDGSLYFQPDLSRYGRIQPRVNSLVTADSSPVTQLGDAARAHGIDYVAWIVCLHNSWLGERHPEATAHTALGTPLRHSLSPAHPDVRKYLLAMIGDLVSRHEVAAIELESPGYMGFHHDVHHVIFGVPVDRTQSTLLGISFNPVEIEGARATGIEIEPVRARIARLIDRAWNEGVATEIDDVPCPEAQAILDDPDLAAYQEWQHERVVSLGNAIREIVKGQSPNTEIRHFAAMAAGDAGGVDTALMASADAILTGYAATPADVPVRVAALNSLPQPSWGMIRAIQPEVTDPGQIGPLVDAWRSSGVVGIDVYNYGLMPERTFRAMGAALNP